MADDPTTPTADAGTAPAEVALPDGVTPAEFLRDMEIPWTELLPEPLRADGTLGRYKSLEDASKALIEQHKTLSTRPAGLTVPGEGATPDQVAAFREALGVPKDAASYELPEGLDPEIALDFRTTAHRLGLAAGQVKDLAAWYQGMEQARLDRAQQGWVEGLKAHAEHVGQRAYEHEVETSRRFIDEMSQQAGLDPAEVKTWLNESGIGDHPILFRLIATAAKNMVEHRIIQGSTSVVADAKSMIDQIRADRTHPLNPANHAGDPAKRQQWDDLYKQAYGVGEAAPTMRG